MILFLKKLGKDDTGIDLKICGCYFNNQELAKTNQVNGEKSMENTADILKLRTLISFLKREVEDCTVTKIARTLGEEKYTISRVLSTLEKEGLVDKSNPRKPYLTEEGRRAAEKYAERIQISVNHLVYEGVDVNSAQSDAFYWALNNTEETMQLIRASDERYRVKYLMSSKKKFTGTTLCKNMKDGVYQFPFLIYREHIENGNNISWANEGFENPCTLCVKNGVGTIQLRIKTVVARHPETGKIVKGYAKTLKYQEYGELINAENTGNVLSFPASVLQFINIGSGMGQILHGSACLSFGSNVGNKDMPEYQAVFTMLI